MATASDGSKTIRDRAADELRGRTSKEEAITSSELSEKLRIGDAEGNPETREIVRDIMKTRNIPIIASSCGYWVASSKQEIEEYTERLDARIQGIQTRKYEIISAWNSRGDDDE